MGEPSAQAEASGRCFGSSVEPCPAAGEKPDLMVMVMGDDGPVDSVVVHASALAVSKEETTRDGGLAAFRGLRRDNATAVTLWVELDSQQAERFETPAAQIVSLPLQAWVLIRLHDSWKGDEGARYWFVDMKRALGAAFNVEHPYWMPDPRTGNEVKFLLGGRDTYNAMVAAMETATGQGHFIYLAGWDIYDDFNLKFKGPIRSSGAPDYEDEVPTTHGEKGTTLRELLRAASAGGAMVRALFWFAKGVDALGGNNPENRKARDEINKHGHAIMDGRVQTRGSHHQKFMLVNGSKGLFAFAGGRDFHFGRILNGGERKSDLDDSGGTIDAPEYPLLDVHLQIRGRAAFDLLEVFLRRYADHPSADDHDILALRPEPGPPPEANDGHRVTVRVCTTFNSSPDADTDQRAFTPSEDVQKQLVPDDSHANPVTVRIKGSPDGPPSPFIHPYSFAKHGRQSGRAQLLYAISSARRYIYFEDQYMVSQEIAEALKEAITRHGVRVIGVIPHQTVSTDFDLNGRLPFMLASVRLSRVIRVLGEDLFGKWRLFCPFRPGEVGPVVAPYQYIHSKVFIFDDVFCTIGSMNFNRRSTTHDSELSLGIYERGAESFAKRLRIRLWARHLGLAERDLRLLNDPIGAMDALWKEVLLAPPFSYAERDAGGVVYVEPSNGKDHWMATFGSGRGGRVNMDLPGGSWALPRVRAYNWAPDIPLEDRRGRVLGSDQVDSVSDPEVHIDAPIPKNEGVPPGYLGNRVGTP